MYQTIWYTHLVCCSNDDNGLITDVTITEKELWEKYSCIAPAGKIIIKDRIADAMFQEIILRPENYDIIAAPNLNGDYISDALAALVGGL